MPNPDTLLLDESRWKLAKLWFPASAIMIVILASQVVGGVYGEDHQHPFNWAFPNFIPTLALMLSSFSQNALSTQTSSDKPDVRVQCRFLNLSLALSAFYVFLILSTIVAAPFVEPNDPMAAMEKSNIFLGPIQGLVVGSLGVLFFIREESQSTTQTT